MKEFPRKFLSLRDKNGSHRRSKSLEPGHHRVRPSAEAFLALFRNDGSKQAQTEEEGRERESSKVEEIVRRLADKDVDVPSEYVREILATKFAAWDVDRAIKFIDYQQKASAGVVVPYNPKVQMLGAENRGNVTCYLDALLFAMFARLEAFECMLKVDFADEPRQNLASLLRLWVNLLRSGELIYTDTTQLIQETLAECGWREARFLEQQDTSEAFAFITEKLQLPLLSLQVDLFHHGKNDADDHKVVYERLLNLAVPPDPEGKGLKLEDCLEEYFNTQVDVLRDSLEEKHADGRPGLSTRSTIRVVTEGADNVAPSIAASPMQASPVQRRLTIGGEDSTSTITESTSRPSPRHRSTSVIQRVVLEEDGRATTSESASLLQKAMKRGSTVVKAVTIPAWQFFRLIPWHAASNKEPSNDVELAMNFNQRPVVSICLKRYMMTSNGIPRRHNTYIDIPDSLRLPHFMMADEKPEGSQVEEDPNGFSTEYKLVLQSVVCHRGDSLQSGHYIAFARVAPKLLIDNRRHDFDPPPDYEEAQWVRFDDLEIENRVTYVDNLKAALKEEMPYLLFYQIVPMVDVAASAEDTATETDPPSYSASRVDVDGITTPPTLENKLGALGTPRGYFGSASVPHSPKPPSIRFSAELERPGRLSLGDGEPYKSHSLGDSRPQSGLFTDSAAGTPAATPEGHSPAITPSEETTAQRLSRAAARFTRTGHRSRPASQTGEGRISSTMTKFGLVRPVKEHVPPTLHAATSAPPAPPAPPSEKDEEGTGGDHLAEAADPHRHAHHKKSKASKSADKKYRELHGAQPERECSLM